MAGAKASKNFNFDVGEREANFSNNGADRADNKNVAQQEIPQLDYGRDAVSPRAGGGMIALAIVCVLSALVGRFGFLEYPFFNDSGLYIYMGRSVAEGNRLYQDFYETKLPGVPMLTALCWRAFGTHWWGYIFLQTSLALGAAWLLGICVARKVGGYARWPTTLAAIVYLNFSPLVYGGFQLETLQAVFAIIGACAALEAIGGGGWKFAFLCGLAAGSAAMLKPSGLAVAGALAITLASQKMWQRPRVFVAEMLAMTVGVAIPAISVFFWTMQQGLLREMPELLRQITLYSNETPIDPIDWLKPIIVTIAILYPIIVRGVIWRREIISDRPSSATMTFAIWWLILEMTGVLLQRRMYAYHFLVCMPPAAMLFGMLPRRVRAVPLAAGLLPFAVMSWFYIWPEFKHVVKDGVPKLPVSEYLLKHTSPGDAIYFDQMPRVLMETNLRPGARYMHLFYLVNYDEAPLDYTTTLLADFEKREPKYIVLTKDIDGKIARQAKSLPMLAYRPKRLENFQTAWGKIRTYLAQKYEVEAVVDGYAMYRRR